MAKAKTDVVKTGGDPRKDSAMNGEVSRKWLRIESGEAITGIVLVEAKDIISCEQCAIWLDDGNSPVWVYTGPEDPSHDLRVEKRYRAYLPLLVDGEQKVWSMGKQAHGLVLDIADAVGSLAGVEIRIKRTGTMLATRYTIAQTSKHYDVSDEEEIDIIELLGPITPEGVRDMLVAKLKKSSYEEVVASFRGKTPKVGDTTAPKPTRAKKPREVKAVEEEDLEDVELL